MEATTKAPAIEEALSRITGQHRPTAVASGKCVTCQGQVGDFRDHQSQTEYSISGMCQACQDKEFGA